MIAWTLALFSFLPAQEQHAVELGDVLDGMRAALLPEEPAVDGEFVARGESWSNGLEGTFELAADGEGRFRRSVVGPLSKDLVFDGEVVVLREDTGLARRLVLGQEERSLVNGWVRTGAFLRAGSPVDVRLVEVRGEHAVLELRYERARARLVVDTERWLPRELHWTRAGREYETRFGEYRRVLGREFAMRVEGLTDGRTTVVRTAREVERPDTALEWDVSASRPADARFDPDVPAELHVRAIRSGHLAVRARVDDGAPGWFLFDTGASGLGLDAGTRAELGIELLGEGRGQGAGGTLAMGFVRARQLRVGPLSIARPVFWTADLSQLSESFGLPLAGILGSDVFERAVVELEHDAEEIRVYDPELYERPDVQWTDLVIYRSHPCVAGRFEGHEGLFVLDTGSDAEVVLYAPLVRRLGLLEGRATRASSALGAGGEIRVLSGDLADFEWAGGRLTEVPTTFATQMRGAFAEEYAAGIVGTPLIADRLVVFDYTRDRLGFAAEED